MPPFVSEIMSLIKMGTFKTGLANYQFGVDWQFFQIESWKSAMSRVCKRERERDGYQRKLIA
jgi:hypothetical protein